MTCRVAAAVVRAARPCCGPSSMACRRCSVCRRRPPHLGCAVPRGRAAARRLPHLAAAGRRPACHAPATAPFLATHPPRRRAALAPVPAVAVGAVVVAAAGMRTRITAIHTATRTATMGTATMATGTRTAARLPRGAAAVRRRTTARGQHLLPAKSWKAGLRQLRGHPPRPPSCAAPLWRWGWRQRRRRGATG